MEAEAVKIVESLDVLNRKGKVIARFRGERGPDGCGIVTQMVSGGALMLRGFRGVPASVKDSEISALCRKEAGLYVRVYGNYTMKVVPENKLRARELSED